MLSPARIARMSGLYTLAGVFNMLLNLVFSVIATRAIGIEQYGILALGMTVFMLADRIGLFGLDVYAQKYMSGSITGEMRRRFGVMATLNVAIAVVLAGVLMAAATPIALLAFHQQRLVPVLRILAVSLLFFLPFNLLLAVLRARHLALACSALMALRLALKLAGLVLLLVIPDKLLAVTLGSPLACSISLLAGIIVLNRIGFRPSFGGGLTGLGNVVRGSAVMLAIRIGYILMQDVGKLVLGRHTSPEDVGIYALAASLALLPSMFHGGTVTVLMPDIAATYREHGCNQSLKDAYHFANALTMLVGTVSFIIMLTFGELALNLLFNLSGPAYAVFCILTARVMLTFFTGATGAFLVMTGHQRIELANAAAMVVLTIVLSLIGVRMHGIRGVAVAGLIATLVLNAAQVVEIRWLTGFMPLTRLHLWMVLVGAFATAVHFKIIHNLGLAAHVLSAFVLIPVTAALFWYGLPSESRRHLVAWVRRRVSGGGNAPA